MNGEGVKKLKSSGIYTEVGLLSQEAKRLNEVYLKYITARIPFVILKIAQTLDGKIAALNGDSKWITSETSRRYVHKLRSKVDAVLIGSKTVMKDNPLLTIHRIKGENPRRIILTAPGKFPPESRIIKNNKDNKTILVASKITSVLKSYQAEIWEVKKASDGKIDLQKFLRKAGQEGIASILVEGGKEIFTSFIRNKLVDKVYYFLAPKIIGKGLETFGDLGINRIKDSLNLKDVELKRFSDDLLLIGYPEWRN